MSSDSSAKVAMMPGAEDIAIRLHEVCKRYFLYAQPVDRLKQMIWRRRCFYEEVAVLEGISCAIRHGETVGIIGRNGAGKSTLLQIIAGTLQPTSGTVEVNGRIAPLIELGAGFNPEFSGHDNIIIYGRLLGMSEREIATRYDDIVRFADIGEYIERPVKTYSSGMYARLAFAVAMHVDPQILIVDEILAVGDAPFQRKCLQRFHEIKESGCTILVVAHDQYLVRSLCDRALYLKNGRLAAIGPADEVALQYHTDIEDAPGRDAMSEGNTSCPGAGVEEKHVDGKDQTHETVETAVAQGSASEAQPSQNAGAENALETSMADVSEVPDGLYRITSVSLTDVDGKPVDKILSGETVHLSMTFEAQAPEADLPEGISFVFNLYGIDGVYVCGATTLMEGMEPHPPARRGRVTVTFPHLPLLAGKFHWRVAINDHTGLLVLAEAKGVCPFQVRDRFHSVGIVDLERTWQVSLDEPAQDGPETKASRSV